MWLNRLTVRLKPLFGLYWDFRLETAGKTIPPDTPLILAPNHTCFLDPWFASWTYSRLMHHLINREWYEKSVPWNLFFRANGTIPVSPGDLEATLKAVREVLDRNEVICIFPEGKIARDGNLQRFRPGIGWFAAVTGVPVVPVGILGARESLPIGSRWPRRGTITLRVGEPMEFPNPGPNPSRRETMLFVRELRERVQELLLPTDRPPGEERSGGADAAGQETADRPVPDPPGNQPEKAKNSLSP